MDLTRRDFLALVPQAAAALALAKALPDRVAPRPLPPEKIALYDITMIPRGDRPILVEIFRPSRRWVRRQPESVIMQVSLHPMATYKWRAVPGNEIVVPDGLLDARPRDVLIVGWGQTRAGDVALWAPNGIHFANEGLWASPTALLLE